MKLSFTLALLLPALASQAQLVNDGATLTVQPGATLYVAGALQNNATATLTNAGIVQLTGDLRNAGTLASTGTLLFSGTASQTFAPGAATLVLHNAGAASQRTLALPTDLTVGTAAGAAVTVFDAVGRLVLSAKADVTGTAPLALPEGLAAGVYLVRAGTTGLRLTVE